MMFLAHMSYKKSICPLEISGLQDYEKVTLKEIALE